MKLMDDQIATSPLAIKLPVMVCLLCLLMISVEFLARAMHDRRRVTLGIEGGIQQALLIRRDSGYRQLLFAGNSLIFEDISQPVLQQSMGPGFHVYAAGIPGSTYCDWRYGLRALFARGSQPDVLVFSISPTQFLRPAAATPVPVSQLWTAKEILAYNREQRPGLTALSELAFEHYSTFFSLRDTARIYVRRFIPGYEGMLDSWSKSASNAAIDGGPGTETAFAQKLSKLAVECGPRTRFVLMIPPTNQSADKEVEPALRSAAAKLSIPVIEPVRETEWPLADFQQDGYHLSAAAAGEFSKLVAADLAQILDDSPDHASGQ